VLLSLGPRPQVFRLDTSSGSQWLLSCNAQQAIDLGHELQAKVSIENDLLEVLVSQFGGLAILGTV
jgi:hypothetical protein